MTLYTYKCQKCGSFSEYRENNDRKKCNCGRSVKKVWGGAFKLIGPGFYKTDSIDYENL